MKKTAVLTMVYNEPEFVPIWIRYYGGLFGEKNLFIIDHGTSDGSLDQVGGANVIHIPRSPKSNPQRASAVSHQVAMLLQFYDHVIQVDVDEFLVADPRKYESLAAFCLQKPSGGIVTSIGLNVAHLTAYEPDLNKDQTVLSQRRWAQFVSPMCKPNILSSPVTFGDGFHGCTAPASFSDVYLLHLRYFDRASGLNRLARTRAMEWASPNAGTHQRVEDDQWIKMIDQYSRLRKGPDLFSEESDMAIAEYVGAVQATIERNSRGIYSPSKQQVRSTQLFRIPDSLTSCF